MVHPVSYTHLDVYKRHDLGFAAAQVGKISVNEFSTYVAVDRQVAAQVLRKLSAGKVKGRSVKVRLLEG